MEFRAVFIAVVIGGALLIALQLVTGILGFGLHIHANLQAQSDRLIQQFLYGAPAFAPLAPAKHLNPRGPRTLGSLVNATHNMPPNTSFRRREKHRNNLKNTPAPKAGSS